MFTSKTYLKEFNFKTEKPNQDEFFDNLLFSVNSPYEINTKTTLSPYHLHLSFDGCGVGTELF
jgi:hypothetical protein